METLKDLFSSIVGDLVRGSWSEKILSIFMIVLFLILAVLIGGILWYAVYTVHDRIFYRHFVIVHEGRANILDKEFHEEYTTTTMITTVGPNNTTQMIPQTNFYPAEYLVTLSIPEIGSLRVDDQILYHQVNEGESKDITYEAEFRVLKTGGQPEFLKYRNFRTK